MAKIGKDEFTPGFVPHHNHGSVDYTSVTDGHVHQCLDVTSPLFKLKMGIIFITQKVMYYLRMDTPIITVPIQAQLFL